MAASSSPARDRPVGKSGKETSPYACNKCLKMIVGRRFRCQDCQPAYDLCALCRDGHVHADASHTWREFPAGFVDFQEIMHATPMPMPVDIDVCLSLGPFMRRVASFELGEEPSVAFVNALTGAADFTGAEQTVTADEAAMILKALGVDSPAAACGKVVLSRFRSGADLVKELQLAGRHGVYTTPCREHLENRLIEAFRRGELPDFADIHPYYVHDYLLSLFSDGYDFPDPVSDSWLARVSAALSDSPFELASVEADAFDNPPNELQMILVRLAPKQAKPGDACKLVAIFPASNGISSQASTV